jgi:hypothetical protein
MKTITITLYPGSRLVVQPAGRSGRVEIEFPEGETPSATVFQTEKSGGECYPFFAIDHKRLAEELAGPDLAALLNGQTAGDVSDEC